MSLVEKLLKIEMSMKFHVYQLFSMISVDRAISSYGPLAWYVKLWVTHAPGMPGTFSPPPTGKRYLHAPAHVRQARAVMHVGITN